MTNHGNGNGGHWLVTTIKALGITTVLSVGFFYWVTQTVERSLEAIANDSMATKSMVAAHVDASGRVNAEILFYLRQLCVQNARMARTDPRDCVPPMDRR